MIAQGIFGADSVLLAFFDGRAYYRDFASTDEAFRQINGLQLDANVPFIYAVPIPGSSINFAREKFGEGNENIIFTNPTTATPAAVFVTDGVTQPVIIPPNGQWRLTKTYSQWTIDEPEYVPIGTLPVYVGVKLYLAARDKAGRLTRILHSVSGRPLDFMIPIGEDGNKTSVDEELGGAPVVRHAIAYDEITALNRIATTEDSFFAATRKSSYLVTPIADDLFGEPRFKNQFLFSTGPENQYSTVDILGDTALIDSGGIRAFNAIAALKNEGRNSVFSRKIFRLFHSVVQTITTAFPFDNYALFAVNTIYGPGIVVYDTLVEKFIALDIYPGVGLIKQFAEIKVAGSRRLFFITSDAFLYEAFADTTTAKARFYFGDLSSGDPKIEHKGAFFYSIFDQIKESGRAQVSLFVDHHREKSLQVDVAQNITENDQSVALNLPFHHSTEDSSTPLAFNFQDSRHGTRLGFLLEWDFEGSLNHVQVNTEERTASMSLQQEGKIQGNYSQSSTFTPLVLCVTGNDGVASANKLAVVRAIKNENPEFVLGTGNHNYPAGASATRATTLEQYWGQLLQNEQAFFALSNRDLDTSNGGPAIQYYLQGHRYFKKTLRAGLCDLFVYNSGMNTASAIVEPDGIVEGSIQANWLKRELEQSTATCKIVLIGHPPYSSISQFASLQLPFRLWGASLVLSSFHTAYEHLFVDGLHYINIGLGGDSTFASFPGTSVAGSITRETDVFAFLKLVVNHFAIDVRLVDTDRNILDFATISI
jgi:hypothetical protein